MRGASAAGVVAVERRSSPDEDSPLIDCMNYGKRSKTAFLCVEPNRSPYGKTDIGVPYWAKPTVYLFTWALLIQMGAFFLYVCSASGKWFQLWFEEQLIISTTKKNLKGMIPSPAHTLKTVTLLKISYNSLKKMCHMSQICVVGPRKKPNLNKSSL